MTIAALFPLLALGDAPSARKRVKLCTSAAPSGAFVTHGPEAEPPPVFETEQPERAEWKQPAPGPKAKKKPTWVRNRLRSRAPFWTALCTSSLVLSWVLSGYSIEWGSNGPPPPRVMDNHAGAMQHASFVDEAVAELLAKGAIMAVSYLPAVLSPLNVVERRSKLRLIVDFTYLNAFLDTEGTKFKYEGIGTASLACQPDDYMFSVDLESAYHHVDMHESTWNYLGFQWRGQYYVFCVLPFGLCTACWVFTKLMRELVGRWRAEGLRLIHYLDDLLFSVAPNAGGGTARFRAAQQRVLRDLDAAGLSVSQEKLELKAETRKKFLGFIIDTAEGVIEVAPIRRQELQAALADALANKRHIPAKLLARICGQLASMSAGLGHVTRLWTRSLYRLLATRRTWRSHLCAGPDALQELQFWQTRYHLYNGQPLWPSTKVEQFDTALFSDASDIGWGGYEVCQAGNRIAQGYFTEEEAKKSSTFREGTGILRLLLSLPGLDGGRVRLCTDNQAWEWIWQGGSRRAELDALAKEIFEICYQRNIKLAIHWIPREQNQLADYISKFHDGDDWQLHPRYFKICSQLWGEHTVDRFASHTNHLCPRFNSAFYCPGTEAVDAFSQDWSGENNWCNPPFGLIGQVLQHLRACGAKATLICPRWPKRPWWHLLCPDGQNFADFVVAWRELPRVADLFLPGPKFANKKGVGCPNWRVFALRIDCSKARP